MDSFGSVGAGAGSARSWAGLWRPCFAAAAAVLGAWVVTNWRLRDRDAQLSAVRAELSALHREADRLAEELRAEARTDALTGLGNRRRWQEQLAHELERAGRTGTALAVALVDLDRFKDVNDSLGHAAGDAVLRTVSAGFAESVRNVDVVARVGGEEFAVALPDVELPDAVRTMERLRTSVPAGVTGSVGLALWDGTEDADALVRRADMALYRAKEAGRNRLVVA